MLGKIEATGFIHCTKIGGKGNIWRSYRVFWAVVTFWKSGWASVSEIWFFFFVCLDKSSNVNYMLCLVLNLHKND